MTDPDWFADDPREWDLGGAELDFLEEIEPEAIMLEVDESHWTSGEGSFELEWPLEIVQVCLSCGRSISRTPDLWRRIQPHFPTLDDGHGDC